MNAIGTGKAARNDITSTHAIPSKTIDKLPNVILQRLALCLDSKSFFCLNRVSTNFRNTLKESESTKRLLAGYYAHSVSRRTLRRDPEQTDFQVDCDLEAQRNFSILLASRSLMVVQQDSHDTYYVALAQVGHTFSKRLPWKYLGHNDTQVIAWNILKQQYQILDNKFHTHKCDLLLETESKELSAKLQSLKKEFNAERVFVFGQAFYTTHPDNTVCKFQLVQNPQLQPNAVKLCLMTRLNFKIKNLFAFSLPNQGSFLYAEPEVDAVNENFAAVISCNERLEVQQVPLRENRRILSMKANSNSVFVATQDDQLQCYAFSPKGLTLAWQIPLSSYVKQSSQLPQTTEASFCCDDEFVVISHSIDRRSQYRQNSGKAESLLTIFKLNKEMKPPTQIFHKKFSDFPILQSIENGLLVYGHYSTKTIMDLNVPEGPTVILELYNTCNVSIVSRRDVRVLTQSFIREENLRIYQLYRYLLPE